MEELFEELERRITDPVSQERLLLAEGTVILTAMRTNIATGGHGRWPPLKPATLAAKRRKGFPATALIASGALLASLSEGGTNNVLDVSGGELTAGTTDPKAAYHAEGTTRMAQRDFTELSPQDMGLLSDMAAAWMRGDL